MVSKFRIEVDDDVAMGPPPNPNTFPQKVIVWRVSFDEEIDEFRLFYKECALVDLGSTDFEVFKRYLGAVVDREEPDSGNDLDDWHGPKGDDSGETPLSIDCDDYSYMAFVVRGKKWRFSRSHKPFTVKRGWDQKYRMARCAWRDPANGELRIEEEPGDGADDPDCTVAFFVADVRNQGQNRRVAFNIFVDLAMTRGSRRKRHIPIVVDPDVGYPGGNYP